MIIPDYVKIEFTAKNELYKKDFIAQSFIISIASLVFLSCCYLLLKSFVNPILYFVLALIAYVIIGLITLNKTYKNYEKYFGHDELAYSNTTLYYNICMNKAGVYTNLDSNVLFENIKCVEIKKGLGPKKLYVFLKDESYLTFHSIKNIEDVKKNIENKLNKNE